MSLLNKSVSKVANTLGLTITRTSSLSNHLPVEATDQDRQIINQVRPFTMTSTERIWTLLKAIDYLEANKVPGDFVECGVWRGGSVMAMLLRLQQLESAPRTVWLYDTFQGMTPPTQEDIDAVAGISATQLMRTTEPGDGNNVWCIAGRDDVERNVKSTNYPQSHLVYVEGDVAQTLPEISPKQISLLRLDTDWYESTKAELDILYPKLAIGGICILDDYGHWQGARKAVDEYFTQLTNPPLLLPVDFSGRIFVKSGK